MVAQANETNTATDETPAKAAPLRALRLAFCTHSQQAAIGMGDPARPAASLMGLGPSITDPAKTSVRLRDRH